MVIVHALIRLALSLQDLWKWTKIFKRFQLITDLQTSKAAAVAIGTAELKGTLSPLYCETSPFSQSQYTYCRAQIEKSYIDDNGERFWRLIHLFDPLPFPFQIADETGLVVVIPRGGTFTLREEKSFVSGLFRPIPSHVRDYATEQGIESNVLGVFPSCFKFTESVLSPGETIYVLGEAKMTDELPKLISENIQEVVGGECPHKNPEGRRYIGKPEVGEHDFLISNFTEEELTSQSSDTALLSLVTGTIFLILSLATIMFAFM